MNLPNGKWRQLLAIPLSIYIYKTWFLMLFTPLHGTFFNFYCMFNSSFKEMSTTTSQKEETSQTQQERTS